jgi:hypothetical protein
MNLNSLYDIKDMLCEELDNIADKGEITNSSLETVDKLTHSLKSIETIIAMNENSEPPYRTSGGSYNSRNGRSRDTGRTYPRGMSGRRYSRDEGNEYIIDRMEEMMESATDKEKEILRNAMNQLR